MNELHTLITNTVGRCSYYDVFEDLWASEKIEVFAVEYEKEWDQTFGEVKILRFLNFQNLKRLIKTRDSLSWENIRYLESKHIAYTLAVSDTSITDIFNNDIPIN